MKVTLAYALLCAILATAVSVQVPNRKLNTGAEIPAFGYGTWGVRGDVLVKALDAAFEAGYRLVDNSPIYGNEVELGKVINRWIDEGKLKREDFFVVTKIPPTGNRFEDVPKLLDQTLARLNLTYVDLLLDHVPVAMKYVEGNLFPKDKTTGKLLMDNDNDINAAWKAMENEVKSGRVKSIGLSNYNQSQIERIIKNGEIRPALLEIELNPYIQQEPLVKFCKENNIEVMAYAPLGSPNLNLFTEYFGFHYNYPNILEDPVVKDIAQRYNKTEAQILLNYAVRNDIIVIPSSSQPDRVRANVDVFNFELEGKDFDKLHNLNKGDRGRKWDFTFLLGFTDHPEYPFSCRIPKTSKPN